METFLTIIFMLIFSVTIVITVNVASKTFFDKPLLKINDAYVMDVIKYTFIVFLITVLVYYGLF